MVIFGLTFLAGGIAGMRDQALLFHNVPEHRVNTAVERTGGKERRLWGCKMPFMVRVTAEPQPGHEEPSA